ncbi:hypothetical protein [Sorangium sp. So ce1153]
MSDEQAPPCRPPDPGKKAPKARARYTRALHDLPVEAYREAPGNHH